MMIRRHRKSLKVAVIIMKKNEGLMLQWVT